MPIDKSQSCSGIRYRKNNIDGPMRMLSCNVTLAQIEENHRFTGWTTEWRYKWKQPQGRRDDYEVNNKGQLIRLGNQIDEELYPSDGLSWICQHPISPMHNCIDHPHVSSGIHNTVTKLEAYNGFSRWADTPKNRELGLYNGTSFEKDIKDMAEPTLEVGDTVKILFAVDLRYQKELGILTTAKHGAWDVEMIDGKKFYFGSRTSIEFVSRPIKEGEFKVGDRVALTEAKILDGRASEYSLGDKGTIILKDSSGDHKVKLDETDAICYCNSSKGHMKHLKEQAPTFQLGQIVQVNNSALSTHGKCGSITRLDSKIGNKQRQGCMVRLDRTLIEHVFHYSSLKHYNPKTPNSVSKPKKKSSLTSKQHEEMVHNQNRSLAAFEVGACTSQFKLKLPDGRVIESPAPVGAAWEEYHHKIWEPGKCKLHRKDTDYSYQTGDKDYSVGLPLIHNEALCWIEDMSRHVVETIIVSITHQEHVQPEVLEIRQFKYNPKPSQENHAPFFEQSTARRREEELDGIWPEGDHVSLSAGDKSSMNLCPLSSSPEKPRGKYDSRYWPERHAPKVKITS